MLFSHTSAQATGTCVVLADSDSSAWKDSRGSLLHPGSSHYLPLGYILDSGAPCAFTRDGVGRSELFFVIGWLLSSLANHVLKTAINHTRNIQSKDFERMPYPWWVPEATKARATEHIQKMIGEGERGRRWAWQDAEVKALAQMYQFVEGSVCILPRGGLVAGQKRARQTSLPLFSPPPK